MPQRVVRPVALLSLLAALIVAGCGPATVVQRPVSRQAAPSQGGPAAPTQTTAPSSPPGGTAPSPVADVPSLTPSTPPIHLAGADWPPTALSTPDPALVLHVPVLMYHRIVSPVDAGLSLPGLVVDPALFAAQLGLLAGAGWHTITLATLQADLAAGRRPAPRTFVITIDDGHRDGITNALPILQRFGFVATYFVIMGRINDPNYLGPADLVSLADAGMEIANHTMNHVDVMRLHGAALAWQIDTASRAIQDITGRAPTTFAYPAGEWSPEAAKAVQAADLGMAVTTRDGVIETWAARFTVPRLRVSPSVSPAALLRRMSGYASD